MERCCSDTAFCSRCYLHELNKKRLMANVLGQCWAEDIATRSQSFRSRASWPSHADSAERGARRQVRNLTKDRRMLPDLVAACLAGAADWWIRRPARYRVAS